MKKKNKSTYDDFLSQIPTTTELCEMLGVEEFGPDLEIHSSTNVAGEDTTGSKIVSFRICSDLLTQLERYKKEKNIFSRSDAIRELLAKGLKKN